MQTVIETKALCKQYGPHTAVDHVELHVPQGCVYGFIRAERRGQIHHHEDAAGAHPPHGGPVRLLGQELTEKSRLPLLRQTGSLIESPPGYLHLTAQENLEIVADLKGVPHKDIGRVLDIVASDAGPQPQGRAVFARHEAAARHCHGAAGQPEAADSG